MALTFIKLTNPGHVEIPDDSSLDFGDVDFSWFMWARPTNLTLNHWLSKGTPDEEDSNYHLFDDSVWKSGVSPSDGNPANDTISNDGPSAVINVWQHGGGDHDETGNDIDVYKNGVGAVGGRKADVVVPAANALNLFLGKLGIQGSEGNGAWATIWSKRLSQNQMDAMSRGVHPFAIEPDSKVLLMPLSGFGGGIIKVWGLTKDLAIEDFSTYTTQAEADACWITTSSAFMRVNITSDRLDMEMDKDNANRSIAFDLGFTLSNTWVMRWKAQWIGNGDNRGNLGGFGLSSKNQTQGIEDASGAADIRAVFIRYLGSSPSITNDWVVSGRIRQGQGITDPISQQRQIYAIVNDVNINQTRWYEMKWNGVRATWTEFSDSGYSIVTHGPTGLNATKPDFLNGRLRYVIGSNWKITGQADNDFIEIRADDIEIWNGVSDLDELTGDFAVEPDWSSKRNHGNPNNISKMKGNPPVELIENYLS